MVAGALGRQKITVRIFVGHLLGDRGRFDDVGGAQLGKEVLGGGTQRIAEIDQAIQAAQHSGGDGKGTLGFRRREIQLVQRIDKESSAAAHIVAQQGDSGAGVIEGFDHHVFQFVAQELFDRGFVFFLNFRVVRQQADGFEPDGRGVGRAFVGDVEQLLHGIGGVGAIAENLFDGGVAGAFGGKVFTQLFKLRSGFIFATAQLDQTFLGGAHRDSELLRSAFGLGES